MKEPKELLRACIKKANCTWRTFAKENGINYHTMNKYLAGQRKVPAEFLLKMMAKYNIEIGG